MATLNPVSQSRSFANGGTIEVGLDDIVNIQQGTLTFTNAFHNRILVNDQGIAQKYMEGVRGTGSISFSLKAGGLVGTSAFETLMARKTTLDGDARTFSMVIKIPNFAGSTPGETITITDAVLMEPAQYTAGGENELDSLSFTMSFCAIATIANVT